MTLMTLCCWLTPECSRYQVVIGRPMARLVDLMVRLTLRRVVVNASMLMAVFLLVYWLLPCHHEFRMVPSKRYRTIYDDKNRTFTYDRYMPLIFVGGVPRSGTTLMRAILDAHPEIRCGEETRVIPRIIGLRNNMLKSRKELHRLSEAGISELVLDAAMASFILEIIARHGEPASRLCNKDPLTLKSTSYLNRLFPNAKFILMLRDGRAVVHSIISRHVTITGFDLKNYRNCLRSWNQVVETMFAECQHVGDFCLTVYYEQLVLHPKETVQKILSFLGVAWNDAVLKHEEFIGKPGGISLSRTERSTDQVIKPVNLEALTKWVGKFPEDVVRDMANVAPMLARLGYDPWANAAKYGSPDSRVAENTLFVRQQHEYWRRRESETLQGIGIKRGGGGGGDQPINIDRQPPNKLINDQILQQTPAQRNRPDDSAAHVLHPYPKVPSPH